MNANQWITLEGSAGPGRGKHIVFISGEEEYRSEEALPMLAQIMARHHGFTCTVLFAIDPLTGWVDPNVQTNIPGMHHLAKADLAVLFTRFRELPDADMKYLVDFVFSGRPVLGIRTSTHAFHYKRNPDSPYAKFSCDNKVYPGGFGRQLLGEKWAGHHGHHGVEGTRGIPHMPMLNHPILRGVGVMHGPTDVYTASPPQDAQVLVEGHVLKTLDPASALNAEKPWMPLAWTRHPDPDRGTGRVFCSTMGSSNDLADASLRRLMVNAMYWCMGMESAVHPQSCVDPIGRYQPSNFGTRKESTGKAPVAFL